MVDVAVVFPPLRVSRDFIDYPYFADLGAIQAAAVVRAAGLSVQLVDAFALEGAGLTPLEDDYVLLGASLETMLRRVDRVSDGPRAIVVALTPFHRPPARDPILGALLASLRAAHPDRPMALADLYQSGQHVVDAPSAAILAAYPEVDALLRFEAEDALVGLLRKLLTEGRPGQPIVEVGGEPELDAIPIPAWDLVDLDAVFAFQRTVVRDLGRPSWAFPIDRPSVPALTSRGCPYRCVHCSSNPTSRRDGVIVAPKTQRRHTHAYLDRLFADLKARGARRVHLLDELINVNPRHFDGVLDLLAKHDLAFEIPNGMRADALTEAHLRAMKGRVTTVSVSAESGVQRVVDDVVDKQLDLSAIRAAALAAKAAEVPLLVHFMIGLPGETREEVNQTLAFALELHEATGATPAVQFATPLPGTRLADRARASARLLPLIDDFGPRFQRTPSMDTEAVSAADLARFKWTFDQRMEAGRGPKKVILNVTYKCNNRCTFCATGTRTQFDGDFGRQRELLVKYRKLGVTLLDLDGGEPTLNPNLIPLIRFARRIGYERVNVTTNARMASYPEFALALATSGVTSILVSVHGPDAQTHAQNVGVAEAFDQTVEGLRNFLRLAPSVREGVEIGSNITITKSNAKKLRATAELLVSLGVRWWNLQFLTPFGRATSSIAPDTDEAAREAMSVMNEFEDRLRFQVINLPFCFMPGHERHLVGDMLKLERHMLFVNNEEVNLFEYLRERRVRKPVCEACPHSIFCGGFFELDDVPEPTWLVRPEDLVRPIATEIPRASAKP